VRSLSVSSFDGSGFFSAKSTSRPAGTAAAAKANGQYHATAASTPPTDGYAAVPRLSAALL
jgi:hypothetical protein